MPPLDEPSRFRQAVKGSDWGKAPCRRIDRYVLRFVSSPNNFAIRYTIHLPHTQHYIKVVIQF
jgi:hypothetical protein